LYQGKRGFRPSIFIFYSARELGVKIRAGRDCSFLHVIWLFVTEGFYDYRERGCEGGKGGEKRGEGRGEERRGEERKKDSTTHVMTGNDGQ
jgi:hypothetical protein